MSGKMQSNKLLVLLVALLLISNVVVLMYFLNWGKPVKQQQRPERGSPVMYVQKKVGFTDEQTKAYQALYDQHHDSLRILGEENRKARKRVFTLMQEGNLTEASMDSIATRIGNRQRTIEMSNFRHFQKVRAICQGEQVAKFDSLMMHMVVRPPRDRNARSPRLDSNKTGN